MQSIKKIFFSKGIFELNEFNRKIIDSAPMSIMFINKNGNIIFVNQYFKNISSEKSPLLKNIFETDFFIKNGLDKSYRKLLEKGIAFKRENCPSHCGNKFVNIVAVPLVNEEGLMGGALSMAIDVTDAVLARRKLKNLNAELEGRIAQKTKQLREMNDRLEKILELKMRFISDASHELRTPLAIAKLNLELFKNNFADREAQETLMSVDNEINKVSDILSDISFFTSVDGDASEKISFGKVNLTEIIESACRRLKILSSEKNINIIFKKEKNIIHISGDKGRLEKLFLNIIGNSIKYGKKTGWVKIHFGGGQKNKFVDILISDNGIGIPKKDVPFIFDRFYRADMSKETGEGGFGLGLAICKWIVEQHKGVIGVESNINEGSVFTISLPVE